jgi:ribonuclease P protein subunit RPR2
MERRRGKPKWLRQGIEKRIEELLELAEENADKANDYAALAWKYKTRYRVSLPEKYKKRVCRKCRAFLTPGRNLEVRAAGKFLVYRCLECGNVRKYGYEKGWEERG